MEWERCVVPSATRTTELGKRGKNMDRYGNDNDFSDNHENDNVASTKTTYIIIANVNDNNTTMSFLAINSLPREQ